MGWTPLGRITPQLIEQLAQAGLALVPCTGGATMTQPVTATSGPVYAGPVWTGTGTKDTAAAQAWVSSQEALSRTVIMNRPGTPVLHETLKLTGPAGIVWGGDTQTWRSSATLTGPLVTANIAQGAGTHHATTWQGSPTFEGSGVATSELVIAAVTKITWIGFPRFRDCKNATGAVDVVINAGGFRVVGGMTLARKTTTYGVPTAGASLKVTASDCQLQGISTAGMQMGVWVKGADVSIRGLHASNAQTLIGIRDTGTGTRLSDYIGDSMGPVAETATGATGSHVIDAAWVQTVHRNVRVLTASGATGASSGHIPATSYVGPVTAGTSFNLTNATGANVNCTGAVTKVKLVGTAAVLAGSGGQVTGGLVQCTAAGSNTMDGIGLASQVTATTKYLVGPLTFWGHSATHVIAKAFAGRYPTRAVLVGTAVFVGHVTTKTKPST